MKETIGHSKKTMQIINDNNFNIKKKFGQNFLIDQNILTSIVNTAEIEKDTDVIEIGPGLGALTQHIVSKANRVLCYEIDKTLIPILNENFKDASNLTIINEDILKVNIEEDIKKYLPNSKKIYLIANLPYYITTPIILNLLENTNKITKYVMMMQKEVALRICSKPNVKDYNALSIVIQYKARATKELDIPSTVFIPRPNVDSAVVKLELYEEKKYHVENEELFFRLIRVAFAQRRKTLANNLMGLDMTKEEVYLILEKLNINKDVRAEALSINDFINIVNELT